MPPYYLIIWIPFSFLRSSVIWTRTGYTCSCLYMEANISTFLNLKISRAQGSILPIHTVVKRHILFWKKKSSNCWLAFLELFIQHVLLVTKNITLCVCTFRFHFLNWILHSEPLQTYSHLTAVLRCKPHVDILTATSFPQIIFPENEVHEIQCHTNLNNTFTFMDNFNSSKDQLLLLITFYF